MRRTAILSALPLLAGLCPATSQAAIGTATPAAKPLHHFLADEDKSGRSLAYVWLDLAEEATARDVDAHGARPTVLSRTLAIWATAMYDAWAAYDDRAVGTRLGGEL